MTRADLKMWLPALILVVVNLLALAAYRWVYADRAQAREVGFDRARVELEALEGRRQELERYVAQVRENRRRLAAFFGDRLGDEESRLTAIITEIKSLARTAGLEPSEISYRMEPVRGFPLSKRSLTFSVAGSYLDLRKLFNLLELSDSFVTLEQIALSETDAGSAELRINLQLSVLFAADAEPRTAGSEIEEPSAPSTGATVGEVVG